MKHYHLIKSDQLFNLYISKNGLRMRFKLGFYQTNVLN